MGDVAGVLSTLLMSYLPSWPRLITGKGGFQVLAVKLGVVGLVSGLVAEDLRE